MTPARKPPNDAPVIRSLWHAWPALITWLAALPAAAQSQLWIRQLGTSGEDLTGAAAPDGAGGVYVGGFTEGNLGGPNQGLSDAWFARYDGLGNALWTRQLGSSSHDSMDAAAPDGSIGVYVIGSTEGALGGPNAGDSDAWLARYDAAGNRLWVRQFGSDDYDAAHAAAPDGSGGTYVSGWTLGSLGGPNAGGYDAWLARYDGAGAQVWIRQIGSSSYEAVEAAAPDGSGGAYVSGATDGSPGGPNAGFNDVWVARYDGAGNQLWIRQLGSILYEAAFAAAPDGSGGVYVSGWTTGNPGGSNAGLYDVWLARYDGAGSQLWLRQLGSSDYDFPFGAAPDGSGGVVLSGWTSGDLGGPNAGGTDAWLASFDGAGNQIWIQQLGTAVEDQARAIAPDGSGGVLVSGSTAGSLGGPNAGGDDAWVARYEGSCGATSSYCTASSTSIAGCQAAIGSTGSPNLANPSGFTISSGSVPGGGNVGICFFGDNGAASTPFGTLGGQVCVQPPFFRSTPKAAGGHTGVCDGVLTWTLQDLINASPIVVLGASIHVEILARDPSNPDGFLLSDGLQFTTCP